MKKLEIITELEKIQEKLNKNNELMELIYRSETNNIRAELIKYNKKFEEVEKEEYYFSTGQIDVLHKVLIGKILVDIKGDEK